ncbi:MAG: 50S ribosomal protein L6 [Sphingobacteriales bacterium]|nr:50S ribosomal protein L6 [Sphingobacteriales bacterium]
MSRIGKKPVTIPAGVQVNISKGNFITVKGPKGELSRQFSPEMIFKIEGNILTVERPSEQKRHRSLHGLSRTLIANMIHGVSEGFTYQQEVVGVGYKVNSNGQNLEMSLGFSHDVVFILPDEVKVTTETLKGKNPVITLQSHDKELLGLVASKIRALRKPEPYKGKGIKFVNETIRRKAGKTAAG